MKDVAIFVFPQLGSKSQIEACLLKNSCSKVQSRDNVFQTDIRTDSWTRD